MPAFKPLNTQKYQKTGAEVTPDTVYWKRLGEPTLVKEFGAIDYIDFSPIEPHYFAVTCSVRVQLYSPITKLVVKNLSRFQETAYGGTFRQDGRLLVAGDEQGLVKLFDTSSRNILRLFKGHKGAVHRTHFTPDLLHIASFSDDKSVKLWDVATEKALQTYSEHEDYVRAGAVNPVTSDMIVSGGYDGKINLYDTRTEKVCFSVDHGCPVESMLFIPSGGIFLSAGGTEVRVWDILAGCRLLTKMSQHHKTVTFLRLGSNGKRILSGGLDRHVKIYDVASYQTVHTLDFPNSVLSLGVSPNDQTVVAGMVDGLISIQNMEPDRDPKTAKSSGDKQKTRLTSVKVDHEIVYIERPNEAKYNKLLRGYQYAKCLDSVMIAPISNKKPAITVSVMQELIHRKGLHRALAHRDDRSLAKIITFICRFIGEHRFLRVLLDVTNVLLDTYEATLHELSPEIQAKFANLGKVLQKELELTQEMLELQGSMDLLLEAAKLANNNDEMIHFLRDTPAKPKQSQLAKESSVLSV